MDDSRLVYSTEFGRACPECGRPIDECMCPRGRAAKRAADDAAPADPGDGIVRIRRESKSRGGKTVTTITGVPGAARDAIAAELKRRCGIGGSVKDGVIVIQGDNRDRVAAVLQERGYKVKLAGG